MDSQRPGVGFDGTLSTAMSKELVHSAAVFNTRPAAHICTNLPKVCSRGGQTISANNPDNLEMWQGNSFHKCTVKWKGIEVLVLCSTLSLRLQISGFCVLSFNLLLNP